MSKSQEKEQEKTEALESLRNLVKRGDTVYTVLRNVSRSGMSRDIDLYIFRVGDNGKIYKVFLSYLVCKALDYRQAADGSVKVGGAGMDMGFHLVYTLSRTLFKTPDEEKDSGYALSQEWI